MNAPVLPRSILKLHIKEMEFRFPLKIVGVLPRGAAPHVSGDDALDLLGEGLPGLSYFEIAGAEGALSDLIGRPVGIVMTSELSGAGIQMRPGEVEPL